MMTALIAAPRTYPPIASPISCSTAAVLSREAGETSESTKPRTAGPPSSQ